MQVEIEKGMNNTPAGPDEMGVNAASPKGWMTPKERQDTTVANGSGQIQEIEEASARDLPAAAKRAKELINELKERLGMEVRASYLRVRPDAAFHVLLLIDRGDFLSPKIAAAKLFTEAFAKTETYDICFTFSILSESVVNNKALPNDYALKYLDEAMELS